MDELENEIQRLKFVNEKLHKYNDQITKEVIELRLDNKRLAEQVDDYVRKLRVGGLL
tara:strand:+ start:254 stop:424 length:171 start_codon:yes stop_codon:yes gene_type:complete